MTGTKLATVLLVDDEPDILDSLQPILEDAIEGLRVLSAPDGARAIEVLRRERVDLILSDFRMPGMDGLEFLSQAAKLAPGVPRILLTAYPDLDVALRAINQAGVDHFLTKPVDASDVVEQVRAGLLKGKVEKVWRESVARSVGQARSETQGHR